MKTKISLVLLGLGLVSASAAYAGTIAEPISNDINVTAPDQAGSWSFGATAVFMQPTNKDFTYADQVTAQVNSGGTVSGGSVAGEDRHHSVDQDYQWWFGADIAYNFPGNGRDVTLAYEGLHGTDTDSVSTVTNVQGPNNGNGTINGLISDFTGFPYNDAEGKTDTAYDAGDLLLGQKLDVGSRVRLHPFVGIRYAHLDIKDTGSYFMPNSPLFSGNNNPTLNNVFEESSLENRFDGVGPRLGSDAQINLGNGFSLRGRLGLSALIGSQRVTNEAQILVQPVTGGAPGVLNGENNTSSDTRVVPEIDGRLGLNYTMHFNSSNTALGFELGWQATNYFNVIADQYPVTLGLAGAVGNNNNNGGVPASSIGTDHYADNVNFGVQGPYARVQLDVA